MTLLQDPASLLANWLEKIQQLHPQEIDMGLERVRLVADRLALSRPAPMVITVGGTNGKGSHVATLDAVFRAEGLRVGCYTSPHLVRYNERVCIQGQPVSDQALVHAFEQIEAARAEISLSYFEFATLAALLIFRDAGLDVAVLEVGMGGRLDAVNIIDPDIAVITNIDLDHQEWLGDTRELIAIEKAGIFRAGIPVVCAETSPPQSLLDAANALGCPLYLPGRDYIWQQTVSLDRAGQSQWSWQGDCRTGVGSKQLETLMLNALPLPKLAPGNVASALQAAALSGLLTRALEQPRQWQTDLSVTLQQLQLQGRQQWLDVSLTPARVMVDVAHNPHAALALAARLQQEQTGSRIHMILAMMADKDHAGFYHALEKQVDFWYIAHFNLPRCLPAGVLAEKLQQLADDSGSSLQMQVFDKQGGSSVAEAFRAACQSAARQDIIVVCGSFITVSDLMLALDSAGKCSLEIEKLN